MYKSINHKCVILLILYPFVFFTVLIVSCTGLENKLQTTAESSECKLRLSKWLRECTIELVKNQPDETQWFNNIGANNAEFIPASNPAEEIFQKCQSIQPLSVKEVPIYEKCMEDCISEMQSINQNTTHREVNQLLRQNSGIFSPQAAIYSHSICDVLKVRIEFEAQPDENSRLKFNENDKVKAVSMPYLGLVILD